MTITKDMIIADVLKKYPQTVDVFNGFNMGCVSCMGVQNESLEKGCLMHGMDVKELVDALVKKVAE